MRAVPGLGVLAGIAVALAAGFSHEPRLAVAAGCMALACLLLALTPPGRP